MTVTSLEELAAINYIRKQESEITGEPYKELSHADFMKKIRKVLGEDAGNFSGVYLGANNEERPCYYLPEREIHILLMSENSVVRAKVYDEFCRLTKILRAYEGYQEEKAETCKMVNQTPVVELIEPTKPAKKSILQWVAGKLTIGG